MRPSRFEFTQRGHLPLKRCVGEGELILLSLIPFRDGFLANEIVGEFAEAGGIAGAGDAVRGRLLERIEGAGDRPLGLSGDGGFIRGAEARIVQDALKLRVEQIAGLLLLIQELLVLGVDVGELLVGNNCNRRASALRSIRRVIAVGRCKKSWWNRSNHVVVFEAHSPIPAEIAVVELWYC